MNSKTKKIVDWVLGGLIAAFFLFSAYGKLTATEEMINMSSTMGISASTMKTLAIIEILSAILFLIPRTGVLGTLLLAAYMGGAIATHLEHGQSFTMQCIIQAIIWIVAVIRFPELRSRMFGS
jgi:TRAP-type C4-dicarboxylate transport system permease small subunit